MQLQSQVHEHEHFFFLQHWDSGQEQQHNRLGNEQLKHDNEGHLKQDDEGQLKHDVGQQVHDFGQLMQEHDGLQLRQEQDGLQVHDGVQLGHDGEQQTQEGHPLHSLHPLHGLQLQLQQCEGILTRGHRQQQIHDMLKQDIPLQVAKKEGMTKITVNSDFCKKL